MFILVSLNNRYTTVLNTENNEFRWIPIQHLDNNHTSKKVTRLVIQNKSVHR